MQGWRAAAVVALVLALGVGVYVLFDGQRDEASTPSAPTHGCDHAGSRPSQSLRAAERATLCLLNAERRARGLRPLRANGRLRQAALRHSRDMVERDFFAHENPDGVSPRERIGRAGYPVGTDTSTGENLATGEREASTPAVIVDGWMHSRGHRRIALHSPFRDIGIGIVAGTDGGTYTTTFGGRVGG